MLRATNKVLMATLLLLGVAIPLASLMAQDRDRTEHGWMGIYIRDLEDEDHAALGLKTGVRGVVVSGVDDEGPAGQAGVEPGDVITKINGKSVRTRRALLDRLDDLTVGDEVRIEVAREDKNMDFELKLAERPAELGATSRGDRFYRHRGPIRDNVRIFDFGGPVLGIETLDLESDDLAAYFGVSSGEGVLVTDVLSDGGAGAAGVKPGDVVLKLNDEAVKNTADLRRALKDFEEGDKVTLTLVRKNQEQSLEVELTESALSNNFNFRLPRIGRNNGRNWRLNDDMGDIRQELRELKRDLRQLERELRRNR